MKRILDIILLLVSIAALSVFFAQVEIQIEGSAGWGKNLPTWRIEDHWLLDLFFGGRPMTGYHAWVLPFMFLIFHFGFVLTQRWSRWLEARALASLIIFWALEDWLWFMLNPAFGPDRFNAAHVPWHKNWFLGVPVDYWVFGAIAIALLWYSFFRAPRAFPGSRTPVETPK